MKGESLLGFDHAAVGAVHLPQVLALNCSYFVLSLSLACQTTRNLIGSLVTTFRYFVPGKSNYSEGSWPKHRSNGPMHLESSRLITIVSAGCTIALPWEMRGGCKPWTSRSIKGLTRRSGTRIIGMELFAKQNALDIPLRWKNQEAFRQFDERPFS